MRKGIIARLLWDYPLSRCNALCGLNKWAGRVPGQYAATWLNFNPVDISPRSNFATFAGLAAELGRQRAGEHGVVDHDGGLLIRVGVGPIAAGVVAFATGFIAYLWLMAGPAPMNAGSGVQTRIHSAFGAIDPALLDPGAVTVGSNVQVGFNARFASLEDADAAKFVLGRRYDQAEARPAASPFGERFSFDQSDAPGEPLQRSASFDDRFNHEPSGATTARKRPARRGGAHAAAGSARGGRPGGEATPGTDPARERVRHVFSPLLRADRFGEEFGDDGVGSQRNDAEGLEAARRRRPEPHRDLRHLGAHRLSAERPPAGGSFRLRRPHGRCALCGQADDWADAAEHL